VSKKVLILILGFGMITAGIAGITTSLVDQKNHVALQKLEKIQDEAKTAAAEEQRKLEEKQQEIDRLARSIEAERLQLQEDRRRLEQHERSKMAAIDKQKRRATQPKTAIRKDYAKEKPDELGKKAVLSSRTFQTTLPPRPAASGDVKRISQRAGLEAARSLVPVKYYNRNTGERVLAEPFNNGPGSVLVRIRVWRGERLDQDTLINLPKASLGDLRGRRPYL
jgi:hypothetical protein